MKTIINGILAAVLLVMPANGERPPRLVFHKEIPVAGDNLIRKHTVVKGEHLMKILRSYGILSEDLPKIVELTLKLNPQVENINFLIPGQVLNVPISTEVEKFVEIRPQKKEAAGKTHARVDIPDAKSVETRPYVVGDGDTIANVLRKIANLPDELIFNEYINLFKELNPSITNPNKLYKGLRVMVPIPPAEHALQTRNWMKTGKDRSMPAQAVSGEKKAESGPETGEQGKSSSSSTDEKQDLPKVMANVKARSASERNASSPGMPLPQDDGISGPAPDAEPVAKADAAPARQPAAQEPEKPKPVETKSQPTPPVQEKPEKLAPVIPVIPAAPVPPPVASSAQAKETPTSSAASQGSLTSASKASKPRQESATPSPQSSGTAPSSPTSQAGAKIGVSVPGSGATVTVKEPVKSSPQIGAEKKSLPAVQPREDNVTRKNLSLSVLTSLGFLATPGQELFYPAKDGKWVRLDLNMTPQVTTPWGKNYLLVPPNALDAEKRDLVQKMGFSICAVSSDWSLGSVLNELSEKSGGNLKLWQSSRNMIMNSDGIALEFGAHYMVQQKSGMKKGFFLIDVLDPQQAKAPNLLRAFLSARGVHLEEYERRFDGGMTRVTDSWPRADSLLVREIVASRAWSSLQPFFGSNAGIGSPPSEDLDTVLSFLGSRNAAEEGMLKLAWFEGEKRNIILNLPVIRIISEPEQILLLRPAQSDPYLASLLALKGYKVFVIR